MVITCNGHHEDSVCDFLNNLTSVQLTGPDNTTKEIFKHGVESVYKDTGYTTAGTTLTLGKDLFEDKWSGCARRDVYSDPFRSVWLWETDGNLYDERKEENRNQALRGTFYFRPYHSAQD